MAIRFLHNNQPLSVLFSLLLVFSLTLGPAAPAASAPRNQALVPASAAAQVVQRSPSLPSVTAVVPTASPGVTPTVTSSPSPTPAATQSPPAPTDAPTALPTVTAIVPTPTSTPLPTVATPTLTPTFTLTPTPPPTITPTATPTEPLDAGWALILPGQGGRLASPDGRLQVDFPPGAVDQPVEARFEKLEPLDLSPDTHLFYRFDLSAWPAGQPDLPPPTFLQTVALTVTYTLTDVEGLSEGSLHLVTWDEGQGLWMPISATLDITNHRLTARLSHFSQYAASGGDDIFFLPRLEAGQVSLFTGESSFSYDLEMPAGAGGLKVPLTLRYSGDIPNGMIHGPYGDDNSDTGWVGVGWTLEIGKIEDGSLTMNGLSGEMMRTDPHIGPDILEEKCDWDGTHCGWGYTVTRRHRLKDEQFAYITSTRFNSCQFGESCGGHIPPDTADRIEDMGQFDVWTKDGAHYIFGSQQFVPDDPAHPENGGPGSRLDVTANDGRRVYQTYLLDTIIDPHGNRVEIEWKVWPKKISDKWHLKEAYPSHIRYTKNTGAGDTHAEYDVEFVVGSKDYDTKCPFLPMGNCRSLAFTGRLLTAVNVWYLRPGYAAQSIRRYELGYYDSDSPHYYRLDSITQKTALGGAALPATTFTYYPSMQIGWAWDEQPKQQGWVHRDLVTRPFLWTVSNGYGGALTFGYQVWCLSPNPNPPNEPIWEDVGCTQQSTWWLRRFRVSSKELSAVGGTPMPAAYDYDQPGYTLKDEGEVPVKAFIGFGWAMEDDAGGQRRAETIFYNTMSGGEGHPNDPMKGKTSSTRSGKYASGNWQEYTETAYTYTPYNHVEAGEPTWPADVYFIYVSETIETTCDSTGSCQSKMTRSYYDRNWQNCGNGAGWQYGNVTRVEEYDSESASDPYRTKLTGYCPNIGSYPNPIVWIIGKPAFENLYSEDIAPDKLLSSTWYIYSDLADPAPTWQQTAGSKGELRGVRRVAQVSPSLLLADTRYWYDAFGNVITETVYNSQQLVEYGDDDTWASANPQNTRTEYDVTHHTFPYQITNPMGHTEERLYYGINDTPGDPVVGSGLPGQLKLVRDTDNDVNTWYAYDVFGRPAKEIRAGDTESIPTLEYEYVDGYSHDGFQGGKRTEHLQEISGDPNAEQVNFSYYDGLGRLVETLAERTNGGAQALACTMYDALGRQKETYVPYVVNDDFWNFKALDDPSRAHTTYLYDALGRAVEVAAPDGSTASTAYVGQTTINIDGNGHRRDNVSDAFGRLMTVHEYLAEPAVYEAVGPDLYHLIGNANSGAWWSPTAPGAANTLTYGPYDPPLQIGAGQVARFRLAIDVASGNDDAVARLDVYDATSSTVLAQRDVRRRDFIGGMDKFSDFALPFDTTNRSGHLLEYRVYWYGVAQMAHKQTAIIWKGTPQTTSYQYDRLDHLTDVWDAAGNHSQMWYDLLGRKTAMHDPDMSDWDYAYDAVGNLTSQTDAKEQTITFQYNALNQVTLKDLPTGSDVIYYYNEPSHGKSVGKITRMIDGSGWTSYLYNDARGRLTEQRKRVTPSSTFKTQWSYDAMDRVVWTRYPGGNNLQVGEQVNNTYRPSSLLDSVVGASTYVQNSAYDDTGRVDLRIFGSNLLQTDYVYYDWKELNGQGRLHEIKTGPSSNPTSLQSMHYSYDAVGNVLSIQDNNVTGGAQTQTFTYDGLDRLLSATVTGGGAGQGQYIEGYTYYPIGNLWTKGVVTYTYPPSGAGSVRPHAVTSTTAGGVYEYDDNGNMTRRIENGATYQQDWDAENRLTSVLVGGHPTTFVYDGDGQLVAQTAYENLAAGIVATCDVTLSWPGVVTNEDAWADSGSGSSGEFAYTSPTGLHWVKIDLGATYTVDRLKVWHYAADGRTYHHVKAQVSANGTTWTTVFDSDVSGEYPETAAGRTDSFTAQPVRYVREYLNGSTANSGNHWVEIEVWGTRTTQFVGDYYEWNTQAGTGTSYYYAGGTPLAMRRNGAVTYIIGDHLGSTQTTVNDSGVKVSEMRYKAYGEMRYSGPPTGTPTNYRFTGQQQSAALGLYHMGARWYDPYLARWLSADTLVPDPADPQNFNRYSYVRNSPLHFVDPTGHDEATTCDEDPVSCWQYVDPNAFLEAWNNCAECNKDLGQFWQVFFVWLKSQSELPPDDPVLQDQLALMDLYYQQAQNFTNEDLWSQVAGFVPETGFGLVALGAQFTKDASGLSMGSIPIELTEGQAASGLPFADRGIRSNVKRVLDAIKKGGPFSYKQDGQIFMNREALLPNQAEGYYREYTVLTTGVKGRGAQRLVVGLGGEVYYTPNHYSSFVQIR